MSLPFSSTFQLFFLLLLLILSDLIISRFQALVGSLVHI